MSEGALFDAVPSTRPNVICSKRLYLVPASIPTVRAALEDAGQLTALLDAFVPDTWPPDLLDASALEWTLNWLRQDGNDPRWSFYWILLRGNDKNTLIGTVGYKGDPTPDGTVEIGYGVVSDYQRNGYATEAAQGLIRHAFESPHVKRVIAETLPELEPSKEVLAKLGFRLVGDGSEPGVIRYELTREEALAHAS